MGAIQKLKAWAGKLKRDGVTLWFACKNPRTPLAAKALAALVVAYALSPIDPIPDFIPVLGLLDELIVLPVLVWLALKLIPTDVIDASRLQAEEWMIQQGKKPRTKWGVVLVLVLWAAFICIGIALVRRAF